MELFEIPTEATKKQKPNKTVKTSLVGFCWPCQDTHIKEETYRENGELCCKRTGRVLGTDGFHPPIPIEASQWDIDRTLASWESEEPAEETPEPLSRTDEVKDFLDTLALMYDIDTEKHKSHWEYIVSQVVALVDSKKPRPVKRVNKTAQGTQLTLISSEDEDEVI